MEEISPTADIDERIRALERNAKIEERLRRLEQAGGNERHTERPWWRDGKTVTTLAAIVAAIVPVLTVIDATFKNQRDYAHNLLKEQNQLRETYLAKVLGPGVTEADQKKIFSLLVKFKSDPDLQAWAKEQLADVNLTFKMLARELTAIERENTAIKRTLPMTANSPAKQRVRENVVAADKRASELRERLGGADPLLVAAEEINSSYLVRINDLPAMGPATAALRDAKLPVDVRHDLHPRASGSSSDYPVLIIGAKVPAASAAAVMRLVLPRMPWLQYIFIQRDPDLEDVIHLTGHIDWVTVKDLKPLKPMDFETIEQKASNDAEFKKAVDNFSQ
jgi:hypothetical protein